LINKQTVEPGCTAPSKRQRQNEVTYRLSDHNGAEVAGGRARRVSDHEKLSMPLLEDEATGRQFALLILKLLAGREARA